MTPEVLSILGHDQDARASLIAATEDPEVLVDTTSNVRGFPLAIPVGDSA
jgi:hypothetical protein